MPAARAAGALVLVLLSGCGYRAVTPYRAVGGVERVDVRAFENDSTDPELGAAVTAALREELARRGAAAGAGRTGAAGGVGAGGGRAPPRASPAPPRCSGRRSGAA